ncbi:MAG: dihydrodipicolinate synthase family protein [SAR324 cluster bacterium]|nr:dihydrodipicolinate synthase family protein [SAR324 cluster bacterium]
MTNTALNEQARGVFIISVTPFRESGAIDYDSADRLVEFYLDKGVTGITILGMMGEAPKLSPEEAEQFMAYMLKRVNQRVPVIVGVSNPGLSNLTRLSSSAMDLGAAGVMVAPVNGLATEERLLGYFSEVFHSLGPDVPVCYQDYPLSTGVHVSVASFHRLVEEYPQLVMLKHEDWPGLNKLSEMRRYAEHHQHRRVSILTGNGGLYLPQELARGADGAMTGFAYPEMLSSVVKMFQQGETENAENLYDAYLPLVRHEQQPGFGLAIRKEILHRRGVIDTPATRAPGPKLNSIAQKELGHLIRRMEKRVNELG